MISEDIQEPPYAKVIEKHTAFMWKEDMFEAISDILIFRIDTDDFGLNEETVVKDVMFITTTDIYNRGKIHVKACVNGRICNISTCGKENFKYIMYRAIEKNKPLRLPNNNRTNGLRWFFEEISTGPSNFVER